jgi:hypothetical protein
MCKWQMSALLRLKNTIGLTKTVLTVLAMLASVLAWGSAPVRAQDNDGDLGRQEVRVLSQNMYVGANLGDLFSGKIQKFVDGIIATKPDERANCKTAPGFCGAARGMEADGHRQDGPAAVRS